VFTARAATSPPRLQRRGGGAVYSLGVHAGKKRQAQVAYAGESRGIAIGTEETHLRWGLILHDTEDHLRSLGEANAVAGGFQDRKLRARFCCHHSDAKPRDAVNA
jgi:hypothetical protein